MKILKSRFFKLIYILIYPLIALILHGSRRTRVLIRSGDEILLQRSNFGTQKWSLTGGGVKSGEDLREAAAREVEEEVGIKINPDKLEHIGTVRMPIGNAKKWPHATLEFFIYNTSEKPEIKITRNIEVGDARWFSSSNLPNNCSRSLKKILTLEESTRH